jgi:hypothetical protein
MKPFDRNYMKEKSELYSKNDLFPFLVLLTAFSSDHAERVVGVPYKKLTGDVNKDLDKIYVYGQNDAWDFTEEYRELDLPSDDRYSVSSGDIILYRDRFFLVKDMGFEELTHPTTDLKQARSIFENI